MIINTHILMANRIYNNLLPHTEISMLDKKSFLFGNIKPDLSSLVSYRSHRIKDSLDFVLDEANRLIYPKDMELDEFSTQVGVIAHYLADFFCRPHYRREEFNGFLDHMRYEFMLHSILKTMDSCNLLTSERLDINSLIKENLQVQVECLDSEYRKLNPNIQNDVIYAMKASTLGVYYILNNTLFELSKAFVA